MRIFSHRGVAAIVAMVFGMSAVSAHAQALQMITLADGSSVAVPTEANISRQIVRDLDDLAADIYYCAPGDYRRVLKDLENKLSLRNISQRAHDAIKRNIPKYPEPCSPKSAGAPPFSGFALGFEVNDNTGQLQTTEKFADSGIISAVLKDQKDPIDVGIVASYGFAPWNNAIIVSAFLSMDVMNQKIYHTFPGGTFIGTQANWLATTGVKVGPALTPNFRPYLLAGVSVLNQNLNINFGGPVTSNNTSTPGFTLGSGAEFLPGVLQNFGLPIGLFVQYQHTWWRDAQLNTPAASPLFNYTFARQDDTFKLGLNIYFNGPPPAATPSDMAVKAPPSK